MAFKHFGLFVGAALVVSTGCSSSNKNTRADTGMNNYPSASTSNPSGAPNRTGGAADESIAREKDALISQADGSQLGTLRDFSGTTLTVDADNMGDAGSMTVRVDNSVPVFQGSQKVSTDALVPGSDVRVFYATPTDGTQPRAVAIEILRTGEESTMPDTPDNGIQSPGSGSQGSDDTGSFGTDPDEQGDMGHGMEE